MYIFFSILLGLSLPTMAQNSVHQNTAPLNKLQQKAQKPTLQMDPQEEKPVESMYLCSPEEETKMPETFY